MALRFAWDARKADLNRRKHGVAFEEAATVFLDPLALLMEDAVAPERSLILGPSHRLRLLLVVHVELDDDTIRLVSARCATPHERRGYEEGA
jgi:uncharacterized DUF497 family protein